MTITRKTCVRCCLLTAVIACTFLGASLPGTGPWTVQAAMINVHWDKSANSYSGQGILPDPGNDTWNYFQNKGDQSSLLYSDGTPATGIGFTTTGGIRGSDHKGNANQLNGGFIHTDGRYANQVGTITFTGLAANTSYKLAVMGVRGDTSGGNTDFTAGGVTKTAGTTPGVKDDFLPANWAIFDSVSTDGSGNLAFDWTAGPSPSYNNGYLNAVQVQEMVTGGGGDWTSETEAGVTPSGSRSGIGPANNTIGWSFSLDTPRTVTHLGMYNHSDDTTDYDRQTGLWDSAGALVADVVFPAGSTPGNGYELADDFRYVELASPVTLQAGEVYNIGTYYPNNQQPGASFDFAAVTEMAGLTYLGTRYHSGGGWGNPETVSSNSNGYFGPNVRFQIGAGDESLIPEPSTLLVWALLGLLGLGCARRRRGR